MNNSRSQICYAVTYCIAALLIDDDTRGKTLIVGFDRESSVLPVECVGLDEVDEFHTHDLEIQNTYIVLLYYHTVLH